MTFKAMLEETGIKFSEGEFRADMRPPYLVWEEDCQTICANSVVVYISGTYTLYLAVSRDDGESEQALENVLFAHGIAYRKSRSWIGGKQMVYLCEYEIDAKADW